MIARTLPTLRSALLGAAAAALVLTTTAFAGSGVGGVLNLGQVNTVRRPDHPEREPGRQPGVEGGERQ